MQLSLDHLSIFDASAPELITIAAELGYPFVSLWTQLPLKAELPLVTQQNRAETQSRMRETGVRLGNMECFNLTPEAVVADFRPAVALGAELGASSLVAINAWDPEAARALDKFGALCRMGAEYGLKVNVEFISMGQVRTLADAVAFVTGTGQSNAGITVDIMHLIRTGDTPAALKAIDPKLIGYAQICDGPMDLPQEEWTNEGFEQRQIPGEGEFPLADFVAAIPQGVTMGVEVPLKSLRDAGVTPLERARRTLEGALRFVLA
jgi:sugar phosphate isomerase/epimerase